MTERAAEAGFGMLEVIVCVALLVTASVLALGALPAVVRASQTGMMRTAATGIARNAIERARAAAAYYPPAAVADPATRASVTASHAFALQPAASFVAGVRVLRGMCGSATSASDVAVTVAETYDAPSDTLTVQVTYPPDPCAPATQTTLTLASVLAPAAYAPQTVLDAPIADPAQQ